jgi:hypothetical protein
MSGVINDYCKYNKSKFVQVIYMCMDLRPDGRSNKLVGGLSYKCALLEAKKLKESGFVVNIMPSTV